jgi:hypothetical protein
MASPMDDDALQHHDEEKKEFENNVDVDPDDSMMIWPK